MAKDVVSGRALCLSGGGYRAVGFHVGALWRLDELGLLPTLDRVSTVSGGSIVGALLGLRWSGLRFVGGVSTNLRSLVLEPLLALTDHTLDAPNVGWALLPGASIAERMEQAWRRHLVGDATLADLPADGDGPRFVLNATSLQTGGLVRLARPYVADHALGRAVVPELPLARAVAASSAFPPVLSPIRLDLGGARWLDPAPPGLDPRLRASLALADGGVYDNLGLEAAWKYRSLLVVDAGGRLAPDVDPGTDWARQALRVLEVTDHQVRNLRKRTLLDALVRGERDGAYVGIRTPLARYPVADPHPASEAGAGALAELPTRLRRMDPLVRKRLVNWGYAAADASLRSFVTPGAARGALPFPEAPI